MKKPKRSIGGQIAEANLDKASKMTKKQMMADLLKPKTVTIFAKMPTPKNCECDNTHAANKTVCRFCWDNGKRWVDPAKALKAEKKAAMKDMQKVYEAQGQQACEELANEQYSHLTKWQPCSPCESEEPHIDNVCCVCGTKNEPKVLTVTITACGEDDMVLALDEIKKQVVKGFTEGMNKNEHGKYTFNIKG